MTGAVSTPHGPHHELDSVARKLDSAESYCSPRGRILLPSTRRSCRRTPLNAKPPAQASTTIATAPARRYSFSINQTI